MFNIFRQVKVREEPIVYIFSCIILAAALLQLAILCLFGQRLTSSSRKLLDSSYECKWYNQTMSFKKSFIVLRLMCQSEIKIGLGEFSFDHENFYKVRYLPVKDE